MPLWSKGKGLNRKGISCSILSYCGLCSRSIFDVFFFLMGYLCLYKAGGQMQN